MTRRNVYSQSSKFHTRLLFEKYRNTQDEAIREEIAKNYINFVQYLAAKFRNRGEPLDDLTQVGMVGLLKAIDRFDLDRGLEFTTFATPTINGEIKRHFRDKGWAVHVPRNLQELSYSVNLAVDKLSVELQHSPTIQEIATYLGVSKDKVLEAIDCATAHSPTSIDGWSENSEADDTFSIQEHLGALDPRMGEVDDRYTIEKAIAVLSPEEQKVLYLKFYQGLNQTEIANQLGVSQIYISRMLQKTLSKLRETVKKEDN